MIYIECLVPRGIVKLIINKIIFKIVAMMKKPTATTLLWMLLLSFVVHFSPFQAQAQTDPVVYFVQVAAFRGEPADFDDLQNVGQLYIEEDDTGIKRVVLGYYPSRTVANNILSSVHGMGYVDAFIQKRYESDMEILDGSDTASTPNYDSPPQPTPVNDTPIGNNEAVVIKLGTYNHLGDAQLIGLAEQFGEVYVDEHSNGTKTVLLGSYNSFGEANAVGSKLNSIGLSGLSFFRINRSFLNSAGSSTTTTPPPYTPPPSSPVPSTPNPTRDRPVFNNHFNTENLIALNVGIYTPANGNALAETDETIDKNEELAGKLIGPELLYLLGSFGQTTIPLRFYGLNKFSLGTGHDAYIIREAENRTGGINNTYLYIFDKTANQFVSRELLSGVTQNGSDIKETRTTIMDLDSDGTLDLLPFFKEKYYASNGQLVSNKDVEAKVWRDGQYIQARIEDKDQVINEMGLY